jgi:hypothetical protein
MKLSKKEILIVSSVFVLTYLVLNYFNKKKSKPFVMKGSYTVPAGTPAMADALHSFEKRKLDGFGGRMTSQIRDKMRELYKAGMNPDVTDIKITVDSTKYKVDWEATIQPSKDGKAYVGLSTVGSAGGGADARAYQQISALKGWVPGAQDYTLALDFKNPKGIYIRQFFYKYTKPSEFPAH